MFQEAISLDHDFVDSLSTRTLTKRERKIKNRKKQNGGLLLSKISPMTDNQELAFAEFSSDKHLFLHGLPGTGKTYLSMYLALREVMNPNRPQEKLIVVRSAVTTRNQGFMPGNLKEKQKVYESPYQEIASDLFSRGDAYDVLKNSKCVDFMTTSFIRGLTLKNCVVLVDECQNLSFHELDSVITRIGDNCRLIFSGDFMQSDLKTGEKEGLLDFMKVIKCVNGFSYVEFGEDDIVRSKLVKEYIIAKARAGKLHS